MTLFYEGTDMTSYCVVTGAICRDRSGETLDSLDVTVEDARQWIAWGPNADDAVEIRDGSWSSGKMYLTQIRTENGKMTLTATSVKRAGRRKAYATYRDMTLRELFGIAAAEAGMEAELYGMDGNIRYRFAIRNGESMMKMLSRITRMEGGTVKACAGRISGIGIEYAQSLAPAAGIRTEYGTNGILWNTNLCMKAGELTVTNADGFVTAHDPNAAGNPLTIRAPLAGSLQDAGRWARGLLLMRNREAESVSVDTELDTRLSALERIDLNGGTNADGNWIVQEADHDLIGRTTYARLLRAVTGIR